MYPVWRMEEPARDPYSPGMEALARYPDSPRTTAWQVSGTAGWSDLGGGLLQWVAGLSGPMEERSLRAGAQWCRGQSGSPRIPLGIQGAYSKLEGLGYH